MTRTGHASQSTPRPASSPTAASASSRSALHLALPAPEGCQPGGGPPNPRETSAALRRVHDELLGHLGLPEDVGPEATQFPLHEGSLMDATSGWSGGERHWQASAECSYVLPAP